MTARGRHKKKKHRIREYQDLQLNIMPFVDVFSMLNTFLLFTAVFVSIGIHEVQIPFFTNAPPPKDDTGRVFTVFADVQPTKLAVETSWSREPANPQKWEYEFNDQGLEEMHKRLLQVRQEHVDTDKITVTIDRDVTYADMTKVLDVIKLRREGEPAFAQKNDKGETIGNDTLFLYPKVVIGNIVFKEDG
jgi:biopolymer transport protein ExbD